jgi:hypothetical protein
MFFQEFSKFLMQSRGLLKVLIEARFDFFHVFHMNRVEKAVNMLVITSDVVHFEAKSLGVNVFDLKVAIVFLEALRVKVECLVALHWV